MNEKRDMAKTKETENVSVDEEAVVVEQVPDAMCS